MSQQYDNWERLVQATLRREGYRELCRQDSLSSTSSSYSSSTDYSGSSLESDPTLSSDLRIPRFPHRWIDLATNNFSDQNLLARGRSGDLFIGQLSEPVVIKRVNFRNGGGFSSELKFFSSVEDYRSLRRFVPLLGYCLGTENKKFLIYRYLPLKDLTKSFYLKTDGGDADGLRSLDWITRWKIARGVAEGLAYLHHDCNPPLVHGDVRTSSILLDDDFEVRLGSLSRISAERNPENKFRLIRRFEALTSGTLKKGTREHDVYCFGKVLLELVTGKLGISSVDNVNSKGILEETMLNISLYDMELVTHIVDPSLVIDEDMLKEVWAVAIVARACLNPKPTRLPLMRHVLKVFDMVRDENA